MQDKQYMLRAIELAAKGGGWTNPNPNVGAVIVKDGRIIGEGYHERCGQLHAERNAFANLTEDASGATIYVTLEPCCHYGKTPPCTEAIIEHNIARVVIGSRDPNPLVAGKGAKLLREKGIVVEEDFIREECDKLNAIFFHHITTGKPYVAMKYAMTLDGKIATRTGASKWITGDKAREHVHTKRSRYAAILAGIGTVLADDPMLNARIDNAHQPVRVIVDTSLRIPMDSNIVKSAGEYKTIVACKSLEQPDKQIEKKNQLEELGITVVELPLVDGHVSLKSLMEYLASQGLDSVYIEGGGQIHESALKEGIVNHVYAYVAPKIFGGSEAKTPVEGVGVSVPDECAKLILTDTSVLGEDILLEYEVKGGMNDVYWNS
ncbi:MAG: bifunctional diaminohydroxyphosphoribosylaminopyrimidine deaminase/5-amino-6-(5-phosphoribosylamino)uracil reductase RibD [Lachnospiraceae bacterium]|nr:bifunctional diaminohydroxyphosphoribosylaminopyrimidine deaminase/5-amino-6-(5-phosphoribosylamino)uracil reductase RibD [Lachnospiraceae bacterium]